MKLQVHVRLRPPPEQESGTSIAENEQRVLYLKDPTKGNTSEFAFDNIFGPASTQEEVFQLAAQPLVENVVDGFNACCFAYGQTGSGKTYTMYGTGEWGVRGLIPRTAESLLAALQRASPAGQYQVFVSHMEIYLDQIRDIGGAAAACLESASRDRPGARSHSVSGSDLDRRPSLDVMERGAGETFVKDLTYIEVKSVDDVMAVMKAGFQLRQTAATAMNDVSSRSHTIFTFTINRLSPDQGTGVTGRLNLVDLAGSERLKKSESEGQRLKEARAINTSLSALGKVVLMLTREGEQGGHIPFRDSKLTRVLKDSLAGNSCTTLLACLNPTKSNHEECFNTLQFAIRCSNIQTSPHINVISTDNSLVQELTTQIAQLKEELDHTHAHYQKLLEKLGGPGFMDEPGPLERPGGAGATALGEEGAGGEDDAAAAAGNAAPGAGAGTVVPGRPMDRSRAASAHSGAGSGTVGGRRALQAAEGRAKALEAQLQAAQRKLRDTEDKLEDTQRNLDEMTVKFYSLEATRQELAKRNRDKTEKLGFELSELQQKTALEAEQLRLEHEEERSRMMGEIAGLRERLKGLADSIPSLLDDRSADAKKLKKNIEAIQQHYAAKYDKRSEEHKKEKQFQVDNIRQQSTFFLNQKNARILTLEREMASLARQFDCDRRQLQSELEHLWEYASKLTAVAVNMENGAYPLTAKPGLKQFKIPLRDRPPSLQPGLLKHISEKLDLLNSFLARHDPGLLEALSGPHSQCQLPQQLLGSRPEAQPSSAPTDVTLQPDIGGDRGDGEDGGVDDASRLEVIKQELLDELNSNSTVEYICTLERDVGRYRENVQKMCLENRQLRAALRSAERTDMMQGRCRVTSAPAQRAAAARRRPTTSLSRPPASQKMIDTPYASVDRPFTALPAGNGPGYIPRPGSPRAGLWNLSGLQADSRCGSQCSRRSRQSLLSSSGA